MREKKQCDINRGAQLIKYLRIKTKTKLKTDDNRNYIPKILAFTGSKGSHFYVLFNMFYVEC